MKMNKYWILLAVLLVVVPVVTAKIYVIEHTSTQLGNPVDYNNSELALDVYGAMRVSGNITMNGSVVCTGTNGLCLAGTFSESDPLWSGNQSLYYLKSNPYGFLNTSSGGANNTMWNDTGTAIVLANPTRNVGIGTSSPGYSLQVAGGEIRVNGTSTPKVSFESTGSTEGHFGVRSASPSGMELQSDFDIILRPYAGDKYRFSQNYANMGSMDEPTDGFFRITNPVSSRAALQVRGAASQSANLQEWQNSSGGVLTYIDANGNGFLGGEGAAIGTTTPRFFSFGSTYGTSTPGSKANLKWLMYDDTNDIYDYGIGMSNDLMEFQTGTGSGSFGFFPNGGTTEALRINYDGNVGIGTSSPTTTLHIKPSAAGGGIYIEDDNSVNVAVRMQTSGVGGTTGRLRLYRFGSMVSGIDFYPEGDSYIGSGSFGIGDTTPNAQLHVASEASTDVTIIAQGAASQSANLQEWQNSSGGVLTYIDNDGWLGIDTVGATARDSIETGGNIWIEGSDSFLYGGSNRQSYINMYNSSTGRVDIKGLTTTGVRIAGKLLVENDLTVNGVFKPAYLQFSSSGGYILGGGGALSNSRINMYEGVTGDFNFFTGKTLNTSDIRFFTNGDTISGANERMVITYTGNVGIGTSSPITSLDIASGQIGIPDGIVSAPSIAFRDDLDTGLYSSSAGVIIMAVNGATGLTVQPNIVAAPEGMRAKSFAYASNPNTYITGSSNDMHLFANGVRFLVGKSDGSVSIGNSADTTPDGTLDVEVVSSASTGLIVQGAASQSANLQEWQNSSGGVLASVNSAGLINLPTGTAGGLRFGDGDSGIYENGDDIIYLSAGSTARFYYDSSTLRSVDSYGFYMQRAASTSTDPAFAFGGDEDTGMGRQGADNLSLITGGVEAVRIDNTQTMFYEGVYGGMGNHTDAGQTVSIASSGVYYNVSGFEVGQLNNYVTYADDKLTVLKSGVYRISYSTSYTVQGGASVMETDFMINGTASDECAMHIKINNANDEKATSCNQLVTLGSGATIGLGIMNKDNTNDATIFTRWVNVERIGGTI